MDLRANTAVDVLIGPFVDKTDGNTTEDSLTLTQAEIKLSKNGQGLTQKNDVTSAAFDDDGYYNCELDATDTNTEGTLVLIVHQSANALPVRHEYDILSEAAWDSRKLPKDAGFMDVNIKTIGRADAQETEADNLESATANYSATRGLTGTALPAAAADASGGVPISDDGALDIDEISVILADTADMQPRVVAIETDTGTTLEARFTGMSSLTEWLSAMAGKQASDATAQTEMRAAGAGSGAYDATTDSQEANTDQVVVVDGNVDSILTDTNEIQGKLPTNKFMGSSDGADDDGNINAIKAKTDNQPAGVPKNVAFTNFPFFMVDETDLKTPETGLSITAQISKDGGAFAATSNSAAEIASGFYKIDLTQTEMNATVIDLKFTASGAAQRSITIITST